MRNERGEAGAARRDRSVVDRVDGDGHGGDVGIERAVGGVVGEGVGAEEIGVRVVPRSDRCRLVDNLILEVMDIEANPRSNRVFE